MITSIKQFKENYNNIIIIEKIKNNLLIDTDNTSWEEFIDNQEMGDCQYIVNLIKSYNIPNIKYCFGEIEILEPHDENDFNKIMTHHWITINNIIFDFSKGTLKNYVNFNDLYSVEDDGEIEYNNFKNENIILDKETLDPIDSDKYEIASVVDIITDQEEIKNIKENLDRIKTTNFNYKQVDKNDVIWLTVMLKPRNNSVAYQMGEMGVIQCKVLQTFYGLGKLKQLKQSDKIFNL